MTVKCSALSGIFIATHLQGLQMEEMEEGMQEPAAGEEYYYNTVCWTWHGRCTQELNSAW